jgi:chorismate mutase
LHRDIDKIDDKIFKLLAERLSKAKHIGELKRYFKQKITDEEREKEILSKADNPDYVKYKDELTAIYKTIFEQMKKLEENESDN